MTIEDEIRTALREDAGKATPPSDGWDDVRARAEAQTRRRRAIRYPIVGVAAAAAIAAIIAGAVALRTTSESEPPSIATPSRGEPSKIIAAVVDQRLVLIDSETGAELRTLAEGVVPGVTADEEYVYFARGDYPGCDYEIARAPIAGGTVEVITQGFFPQVSPDGRWLAYNSNGSEVSLATAPGRCRGLESELVVRNLATEDERRYTDRFDPRNDPDLASSASVIGWSANSQRILYEVYRGGDEELERGLLDVDAEGGILDRSNSRPVAVPDRVANVFGLAPDGSLVISRNIEDGGDIAFQDREIALSDPATGDITRSIVTVTDDQNIFVAAVDPSGEQVLYIIGKVDPMPLRRITIGTDTPVALPVTTQSAAWVPPGVTSTVPTTTPDTTIPEPTTPEATTEAPSTVFPETIVAVDGEGRLIVMASDDSTRRSELVAPPTDGSQYETVSVGPGNAIAVSRVTPSDNYCSTFETGQIQLVNRGTSRVETVGQGRYPAISPDGRRLAWVGVTDCNMVLRVRDLLSGTESVLTTPRSTDGGPDPQLSGPITWATDSRHLVVPMNVEPFRDWWYVDADSPDGTLSGPVIEQRGEQGGPFAIAALADGTVAAVVADPVDGSPVQLVELEAPDGVDRRVLADLSGLTDAGAAVAVETDLTGEHVLVLVRSGNDTSLYRLDPAGGLAPMATGISAADW